MKRYKFGSASVGIRSPLLDRIIDACLAEDQATANSLSVSTGVSLTSIRKVTNALEKCGFIRRVSRPPKDGGKVCLHLSVNEALTVFVLDLSTPIYTASVIDGSLTCLLHEKYNYDPLLSLKDNLTTFLSRVGARARNTPNGFCAVCTICSDSPRNTRVEVRYDDTQTLAHLDELVKMLFGSIPFTHMSASKGLRAAIRYRAVKGAEDTQSVAYLLLGSAIKGIALPWESSPLSFDPSILLLEGEVTLGDRMTDGFAQGRLNDLIIPAVNLASCILDADTYVIESDTARIDAEILRQIKRAFALIGAPMPNLVTSSAAPRILALGAARATAAEVIRSHLSSSIADKNIGGQA